MKDGDLVTFSHSQTLRKGCKDYGVVIRTEVRGPVPGAIVMWAGQGKTTWERWEDMKILRDVAQSGSASGLGPEGRRFESCHPDHVGD